MAKKTAEKKKKAGFFPIFLLIIFLVSLGACGYLIYGEIVKELSIKNMETDIQTFVRTQGPASSSGNNDDVDGPGASAEDVGGEQEVSYMFDWDAMMAESSYVIGWIQMPGIERISYPIVQHPDDNQYFLTHDWKGNSQSAGAIFLNKYNTKDFTDMNSIVYGHRMKAGSMFGSLKYYEKQDFLDANPYFYVYLPDGRKLTYEILCCSHVADGSDAYMMHYESPAERMAYYEMMFANAVTKRDSELDRFDTTIMLSTCNSSAGYYERVVLLGKLTAIDLYGQEITAE